MLQTSAIKKSQPNNSTNLTKKKGKKKNKRLNIDN